MTTSPAWTFNVRYNDGTRANGTVHAWTPYGAHRAVDVELDALLGDPWRDTPIVSRRLHAERHTRLEWAWFIACGISNLLFWGAVWLAILAAAFYGVSVFIIRNFEAR